MVRLVDIIMVVEVLVFLSIVAGSYYGRKLNMRWHHNLIYATLAIQLLIVLFYMVPAAGYWSSRGEITQLMVFHMTIGIITGLGCLVLVVVFLSRRNEYDLPLLRWTKPLMIFVFFTWTLSFALGVLVYFQKNFPIT